MGRDDWPVVLISAMPVFLLISDYKPIAESLGGALRALGCEAKEVGSEAELVDKLCGNDEAVVVISIEQDRELRRLVWDVVRSKYLNPVIILGCEAVADFKASHPECGLTLHHAYLQIPFEIFTNHADPSLVSLAGRMQPVENDVVRRQIYDDYSHESARMFGLLHDFKVTSSVPDSCGLVGMTKILMRVREFFRERKAGEVVSRLSAFIHDLKNNRWDKERADELKSYLEAEIRKHEN